MEESDMSTASLIRRSASTPKPFDGSWGRIGFTWPPAVYVEGRGRGWNGPTSLTPAADLWHTEHAYVIEVDLPGLSKDDIEVSVENNLLTISGGKMADEGREYDLAERPYGHFVRSFALSDQVDAANVQAHFENGVLRLELPRSESGKPRRIAVN